MITLDANVWIAAFDPTDEFHADSTALFAEVPSSVPGRVMAYPFGYPPGLLYPFG